MMPPGARTARSQWRMATLCVAGAALLGVACAKSDGTSPSGGVRSVTLLPQQAGVGVAATLTLNATVWGSGQTALPNFDGIEWSSSDANIATVDQRGVVRGLALGGPVTITANAGGKRATAEITVTPQAVVITPALAQIGVGESAQLSAAAYDANGVLLDAGTPVWSLSASVQAVATLSAQGVVTGVASGPFTVSATMRGKRGDLDLGVPSEFDGEWSGGVPNQVGGFLRTVRFAVRFAAVPWFQVTMPFFTCGSGYNVNLYAPVGTLVTGSSFQFGWPSTTEGVRAILGSGVSGTFADNETMTGNLGTLQITQTCPDGNTYTIGQSGGAFTATRQ